MAVGVFTIFLKSMNILVKGKNDVDPSEIITKKSLFGGIKKTYKTGWILLKKRKHTKIVNPSGFIIYEEDD